MNRGNILKKAQETINGNRQDSYGNPEDSFSIIAEYWTTYLQAQKVITNSEIKINKKEVAVMMTLLKIARTSGQKYSEDNYCDGIGYLALADDMEETK